MLTVAFPWLLLLLIGWWWLPREQGWKWRFVSSLLLLAALAQPAIRVPGQDLMLLIDVSEAVGDKALQAATELDLSAIASYRTAIYAERVRLVSDAASVSEADIRAVRGDTVDLATALQFAQAQGAQRVLLIGSGIESSGQALTALPTIAIDTVPVTPVDNARIVQLIAPDEVRLGTVFDLVTVVETDRDTTLSLQVSAGDRDLEPITRSVSSGRHSLLSTISAEELGDLPLRVALEVDYSQPLADDRQRLSVDVTETEEILVINDPALASLLGAQGHSVIQGSATDIQGQLDYAAIVIREDAAAFSPGQHTLLAEYVRAGGGLLMTGGEASFGLSGWYRTPVEDVLAVETELPTEVEIPQVAIVMVIDRSGSMRAENPSRMSLAKQGAIDLVAQAHPRDYLGLIAFDHTYEWVFRLRQATDQGKREMSAAIRDILANGGTIVGPAYREALDALRETEAAIKHIILLSDGEFFDGTGQQGVASLGPRPDFATLAAAGLEDGITTTTIGIGEANFATLEQMANAGGGRFFGVLNTQDLPRIFTTEAVFTVRSVIREGPLTVSTQPHPLTVGLSGSPAVDAYIATVLRDGAELLLEGLPDEPLLAVRQVELGRSAALTTDLNQWAGDLGRWDNLPQLLSAVLRWLQVRPEPYSITLRPEGVNARVIVDAVRDGSFLDAEQLEARYRGARIRLEQTAPGRYEALLPRQVQGESVVILRGSEVLARAAVTLPVASLNAEGAVERLNDISRLTGGDNLLLLDSYQPPTGQQRLALWPYLATIGITLFLLELLGRRLGFRLRPKPSDPPPTNI